MIRLFALALLAPAVALAQPAQPAPPAQSPLDELVPLVGPVAGLPGYKVAVAPSKRHCGGERIVITRPKRRPATDAQLAAVFDLDAPTNLNFDPAPKHKSRQEKSLKRFTAFIEQVTKLGGAAEAFYAPQAKGDDEASFAAAARLVQAKVQAARVIRYTEIPEDVRTGEFMKDKLQAFCDKMVEVTEPLFDSARASYDKCHAGVARFPDAWWAPVCRAP